MEEREREERGGKGEGERDEGGAKGKGRESRGVRGGEGKVHVREGRDVNRICTHVHEVS